MTIKEFEQLTGCYPTSTAYAAIEQAYRDFDGDKAAFCQAFQENQDGLASRIRDNANQSYFAEIGGYVHEIRTRGSHLRSLRQQVEDLTRRLEREQEWKPSEDTGNVLQGAYEELAADVGTRKLTEWAYTELGIHTGFVIWKAKAENARKYPAGRDGAAKMGAEKADDETKVVEDVMEDF